METWRHGDMETGLSITLSPFHPFTPSPLHRLYYTRQTSECPHAKEERMSQPKSYICDMDGVLVRGSQVVPGANEFIERLKKAGAKFLVLTNNSLCSPRDLHVRLQRIGLHLPQNAIYTSAMATAQFLVT